MPTNGHHWRYLAQVPLKISFYFGMSPSTVKEVFSRELGSMKYARRWVPHLVDHEQQNHRRASTIELLELLPGQQAYDFDGPATGHESWFHDHYEPYKMFAASRETVTPFVRS
jgi:hypothetical protein